MSKIENFLFEGDNIDQFKLAVEILLKDHKKSSYYMTGKDVNGVPYLSFLWFYVPNAVNLIAPLDDARMITDQVVAWLRTVDYGCEPDTDGSVRKGFRITNTGPKLSSEAWSSCEWNFYVVLTVQPFWNVYSK